MISLLHFPGCLSSVFSWQRAGLCSVSTCCCAPRACQSPRRRPITGPAARLAPPRSIIEVSLVSPSEHARSTVRSVVGSQRRARDHVLREAERVRGPVLVDYGAAEPGKRVREEAGRLFLHRQHLPSAMRVEVPQPAHHSHLRLL